MTFDELVSHALQLTSRERARLAEVLIASLDDGDDGDPEAVQQAWVAEAERRYQSYLRGDVELIPAAQVFAELRAELEEE